MSGIGYGFYDSRTDGEYLVIIEGKGTAGERQYRIKISGESRPSPSFSGGGDKGR